MKAAIIHHRLDLLIRLLDTTTGYEVRERDVHFYEDEKELSIKTCLEASPDMKTVSIVTGPEGGFEPEEAALAIDMGMKCVTMGTRILRCETAPLCALTAVMYSTGNL